MYYLNYFFIMSLIGHFIETFIYVDGNSGILLAPWTPVYGIGTILILLINKVINKYIKNKYVKIILLFLSSMIILSIIEAMGGYLIEYLFHTTFWDYSDFKFNIGKYIAVEIAIIWGLCSILLIYLLNVKSKITNIPILH